MDGVNLRIFKEYGLSHFTDIQGGWKDQLTDIQGGWTGVNLQIFKENVRSQYMDIQGIHTNIYCK